MSTQVEYRITLLLQSEAIKVFLNTKIRTIKQKIKKWAKNSASSSTKEREKAENLESIMETKDIGVDGYKYAILFLDGKDR